MATIQDIVTGALRKLGVLHASESPTATDSAAVLDELNDMMLELPGQQIFTGWATVALVDTFQLEDKHIGGIKAMLAVRVSPAFGGDSLLSSVLIGQAKNGYSRLWGDYHRPDPLTVDEGLEILPGTWFHGVDNVNV